MQWRKGLVRESEIVLASSRFVSHRCMNSARFIKPHEASVVASWWWSGLAPQTGVKRLSPLVLISNSGLTVTQCRTMIPDDIEVIAVQPDLSTAISLILRSQQDYWNMVAIGDLAPGSPTFSTERSFAGIEPKAFHETWREACLSFGSILSKRESRDILASFGIDKWSKLDFSKAQQAEVRSQMRVLSSMRQDEFGPFMADSEYGWGFGANSFGTESNQSGNTQKRYFAHCRFTGGNEEGGADAIPELVWMVADLITSQKRAKEAVQVLISARNPIEAWLLRTLLLANLRTECIPSWSVFSNSVWGWNPIQDVMDLVCDERPSVLLILESQHVAHLVWTDNL